MPEEPEAPPGGLQGGVDVARCFGVAVSFVVIVLGGRQASACPAAVLGGGTSWAKLERVEYTEKSRTYRLRLRLRVVDQPESAKVKVDGQKRRAHIEHHTPLILAKWAKRTTMLFGGSSKFLVGAVYSTRSRRVAVIPFSSITKLAIEQGRDFDENAPFYVTLELDLLHRLKPFAGKRGRFVPYSGAGRIGRAYVRYLPNDSPGSYDPYGQSYGDYFARRSYVLSFVHGPRVAGEHRTPENAMSSKRRVIPVLPPPGPHGPARAGFGTGPLDPRPAPDLYSYVVQTYALVRPTAQLSELAGHPVKLALSGDRSFAPPASPFTRYRRVCKFVPGRFFKPRSANVGFVARLSRRPVPAGVVWRPVTAWSNRSATGDGSRSRMVLIVVAFLLVSAIVALLVWRSIRRKE